MPIAAVGVVGQEVRLPAGDINCHRRPSVFISAFRMPVRSVYVKVGGGGQEAMPEN